jgi:cell division protein FtsW
MPKYVGGDKWLFFTTLLLVGLGLAMVFSASAVLAQERYHSEFTFVFKQAIWALAGLVVLWLLSRIDYNVYKSPIFVYSALSVTTLLLAVVFVMPGSHHTHRWIRFGNFFTFQPSEIAKPVMVLFLAWFLSTRLDKMQEGKNTLLRAVLIPLLFIILIVLQPDLGTALVLTGVTFLTLFLAGMEWKYLFIGAGALLPPLAYLLIMVPFRLRRMLVFLNPDSDPQGAGFHINQSLIAVSTGGVTGRGYMEGVQKLFFLPEPHTDFIYANISEEMGLIGALILLLLFAFFGYRGLQTAFLSQDPFARLAAFGITMTILLQAFFNISVVLSLVPAKGIPLPLISSGGTSLFFTLASIGILLNISRKVD